MPGEETVPRGKSHCSKVVAKSLHNKHLHRMLVARQGNKDVDQLFPTPNFEDSLTDGLLTCLCVHIKGNLSCIALSSISSILFVVFFGAAGDL